MPPLSHFGKMGGAIALGLVTLVMAFVIFTFLLPYIIPLALGAVVLVAIFIAIWAILYAALFVGVAIYYLFKPMQVSRKDKGYSIAKTKEAGKRQKSKEK